MSVKPICMVDKAILLTLAQIASLSSRFHVVQGFAVDNHQLNDVAGILLHSRVNLTFLNQFPNLQWIGVRAKNISYVPEVAQLKWRVFGIPSLAGTAVAEHTFALMLGLVKKLIPSHNNVIQKKWRSYLDDLTELSGKTLGIVGFGTIGQQVDAIAKAFHMNVLIASSPRRKVVGSVPLEELLANSHFVTLHLPSIPENKHFMNASRLKMMKQGSVLINTSRGDMVDEKALIAALESNHLSGAGLDVFENEPDVNPDLLKLSNVLLTPHTGFMTRETQEAMTDALIRKVLTEPLV